MSLIDFTGFESGESPTVNSDNIWVAIGGPGVSVGGGGGVRTGAYKCEVSQNGGTFGNAGLARNLSASEKHATMIAGGSIYRQQIGNAGTLFTFAGDAGATSHVQIYYAADGTITAYRGTNASGTVLGSSTTKPLANTGQLYYVEAKVVLHDATGSVEVKVDDVVVLSLSGIDTKNAGTDPTFDQVTFGKTAQTGSNAHMWDDIYIVSGDATAPNDYLNAPKVQYMLPNGDGSTNQFVGSDGNSVSNWQQVDERPPSTADYNESSTAGQQDLYALSDISFQANDVVKGVKLHLMVHNTDASVRNAKLGVRSGATTDMDAGHAIGTGSAMRYTRVMAKNPVTAVDWTQAEVNALQAGVEVV